MINYGAPVSGYVDYNFEKVGETRRQRYMDNFYASEAVRQSAADLQAAPFEGDEAYRQQLLQNTDNVLQSIADKGDYENMTIAVNRAASGYQKRAKPLEANLAAYNTYKEELDKLYDEGKIDMEDYNGTMALAQKGYSGLQMDEDGNATNYFSGLKAIQNPDVPKMIKEALQGIVADENEQVIEVLGQGPDGMYQVKTTNGIKTVTEDRVENALRMVMEDPRVTQYLGRKAAIRTNDKTDDEVTKEVTSAIETSDEILARIDEGMEGASDEEKKMLERERAKLVESRGELQEHLDAGDMEKMRGDLQSIEYNKVAAMYDSSAKSRYSYSQQTFKQEYDADRYAQQKQQQAFEAALGAPRITVTSGAIQAESGFGNSSFDVMENMNSINDQLTQMQEDWDQNSETWSEGRKAEYANDMARLAREVGYHRSVLEDRYNQTNEGLTSNEEYRVLQEKAARAEEAYRASLGQGGSARDGNRVELFNALREAERDCEEWLRNNSDEDPAEGRRTVDLTMSSAANIPGIDATVARGIQKQLDDMLSVPPSDMLVYAPNSTEQTTVADLDIPPDAKLVGPVTLSTSTDVPGVGRIAQARYQTDDGIVVVNIPLNGQIDIPDLNQHLNAPYMRAISDVQRLGREGVKEHSFPVRSKAQGVSGQMVIDYEAGTATTIFGEHRSKSYSIYSDEFKQLFEENGLELY